VGTEDGSHLSKQYPGLEYRKVNPGTPLPFPDGTFDIVFSNAVLEHVGSQDSQRAFLREIFRVGHSFFITTPNRWFPVEHHTGVPLLHYLPARLYRTVLAATPYSYWAQEENLNILSARSLKMLFPPESEARILHVKTLGFTSNLVVIGKGG
jgi:SAM-dependent methyltransferase